MCEHSSLLPTHLQIPAMLQRTKPDGQSIWKVTLCVACAVPHLFSRWNFWSGFKEKSEILRIKPWDEGEEVIWGDGWVSQQVQQGTRQLTGQTNARRDQAIITFSQLHAAHRLLAVRLTNPQRNQHNQPNYHRLAASHHLLQHSAARVVLPQERLLAVPKVQIDLVNAKQAEGQFHLPRLPEEQKPSVRGQILQHAMIYFLWIIIALY